MQNEPKPEAIAEDFVQFFHNTLAELEAESGAVASPEATSSGETNREPENTQSATTETETTATNPSLDLEQIIAMALGRVPAPTSNTNEESEETNESPESETESSAEASEEPSEKNTKHESTTKSTKAEIDTDENEDEDDSLDFDDDGDWLSQLFKSRKETSQSSENIEEGDDTEISDNRNKSSQKQKSELKAKLEELEKRVKAAEEVAQQVVMATALRLWIEQAKQQSQEFQNVVRQYGIELSDEDLEDAMVQALGQLQHNPNALYQELATKALQAMAREYSKVMRLPAQFQPAQAPVRSNEPRTFEDYLELALREINDRR